MGDNGRRGQLQNLANGPTPPQADDQFGGLNADAASIAFGVAAFERGTHQIGIPRTEIHHGQGEAFVAPEFIGAAVRGDF